MKKIDYENKLDKNALHLYKWVLNCGKKNVFLLDTYNNFLPNVFILSFISTTVSLTQLLSYMSFTKNRFKYYNIIVISNLIKNFHSYQ